MDSIHEPLNDKVFYLQECYWCRQKAQGCSPAARHHPQQGHLQHRDLASQAVQTNAKLAAVQKPASLTLKDEFSIHSILWSRATAAALCEGLHCIPCSTPHTELLAEH